MRESPRMTTPVLMANHLRCEVCCNLLGLELLRAHEAEAVLSLGSGRYEFVGKVGRG